MKLVARVAVEVKMNEWPEEGALEQICDAIDATDWAGLVRQRIEGELGQPLPPGTVVEEPQ